MDSWKASFLRAGVYPERVGVSYGHNNGIRRNTACILRRIAVSSYVKNKSVKVLSLS